MKKATLALACGEVFEGQSCGAAGEATGEVVFNTAHTGYQEVLTDPSYVGQLVTFTVSEVGNYGIHHADGQSPKPMAAGFIARRACHAPSNWRSEQALPAWLAQHGLVGIEGIDTRRLVRILRSIGAQPGIIDTSGASAKALVERAAKLPTMDGQDLASVVSTKHSYEWTERSSHEPSANREKAPAPDKRVVVVDYGVKRGILRQLVDQGCAVTVVPSSSTPSGLRARISAALLREGTTVTAIPESTSWRRMPRLTP